MTPDPIGPLSRRFPLHRVTAAGVEARVEASEAERAALAADLDLPAIHRLEGRFRLVGSRDRVTVTGRVSASIEQVCGVTLDPFPTEVEEDVEVAFAAPPPRHSSALPPETELSMEHDPPDELTGDSIDLGAITAEFLALGLDPFPRKPGVVFEAGEEEAGRDSPFARLADLHPKKDDR